MSLKRSCHWCYFRGGFVRWTVTPAGWRVTIERNGKRRRVYGSNSQALERLLVRVGVRV